jgi:hypothetical protein
MRHRHARESHDQDGDQSQPQPFARRRARSRSACLRCFVARERRPRAMPPASATRSISSGSRTARTHRRPGSRVPWTIGQRDLGGFSLAVKAWRRQNSLSRDHQMGRKHRQDWDGELLRQSVRVPLRGRPQGTFLRRLQRISGF